MGSWHYREPERRRGRRWLPRICTCTPTRLAPSTPSSTARAQAVSCACAANRALSPPPPPRLRSFTVLCLQTSPGLRFSTPAGPDVWVDLRSLAGCRLFMSVSGGKDGYLCSQSPSPAGAPKFPGGQGGAVVSGPLGSVAAFPSSSSGCFHKRKGVGTSTHSRGFTRPGLAAVSVVIPQDSVRSPWWSR